VQSALSALGQNRTRALLTSLGIIFGVASVIAMLAIGTGAQREILEQIRLLGATNVIVVPQVEQEEGAVEDEAEEQRQWSPGLTLADAQSVLRLVPGVRAVSPEIVMETVALRAGLRRSTKLVGVAPAYFEESGLGVELGEVFSQAQAEAAAPVAVIGRGVQARFFAQEDPIGKRIKVGRMWLTVVGVLGERGISAEHVERLGLRDYDLDIYTPVETMLTRFEDRARLTADDIRRGEQQRRQNDDGALLPAVNYHQVDRLTIHTDGSSYVAPVAEVVTRMLTRRHNEVVDFEVIVPETLLAQERRTQTIFNVVLAAIASISLIVGGIGIMNIMLASVMERIREIGVRRSLGATRRDIEQQFLAEAIAISFTGGFIGVVLGIGISVGIEQAAGIVTIVTPMSVALSFAVSVAVGLIFGLLPARRAAAHDPVVALRYE
jgi:putative ABC transport system permease protein